MRVGRKRAFGLRPTLYFDGDSLTFGYGSTNGLTYPAQTLPQLPGSFEWQNFGIIGSTTSDILASALTNIDPRASRARWRQVVIYWAGSNDLAAAVSAATVYSNLVAYGQARQAKGFKVVVLTLTPRSFAGTDAGYEAARQTVNGNIQANWRTFADGLADVGSDPTLGPAGAELNATYYTDKLHMTNAGYALVAGIVKAALLGLN